MVTATPGLTFDGGLDAVAAKWTASNLRETATIAFAGPGAAGNVATEDVVYMLHGLGLETGVDFDRVLVAGEYIIRKLGRENANSMDSVDHSS